MSLLEAISLRRPRRFSYIVFAWILFAIVVQHSECFLPPGHGRRGAETSLLADTLEDRTVKELWKILEESNQVGRGLKSQLKRKQDIINYIEEHADMSSADGEDVPEEEEEPTPEEEQNTSKNEEQELWLLPDIDSEIAEKIPPFLAEKMILRNITSLLPIQVQSFQRIYSGEDSVLQAPTGSGKTLAFVLPLVARKNKGVRRKVASPLVLVLAPSRELARQVGKEFDKFSKGQAATVFGGVPVERHIALLKKNKPQVLISTPGRLRELHRDGHVDFSQISTVVLDEADILLDKADSPDVQAILGDLERDVGEQGDNAEYQLMLVSATMNQNVLQFARDLEIPSQALIRVRGSESKVPMEQSTSSQKTRPPIAQTVQHWHMSCKTTVRPSVAMDLINLFEPLLTIVFVASKAEAESVASVFSSKLGGSVRTLHGDMVQTARSRSIALVREAALEGRPQVLVATDVAARGIDLAVDLVIQFGVPRLSGKEGTFSTELYTHRTGRTGRVRSDGAHRSSNAVMLYDPAVGEGKLVPHLADDIKNELGIGILAKQLPSAAEVVAAAYERTKRLVALGDGSLKDSNDLTIYFRQIIETEKGVDTSSAEQLLEYLARAMALLSKVDPSVSPFGQHASLLTGSTSERTLRLIRNDEEALNPPEVIKACKALGSGKLGRVNICQDGSAVFDLPQKRAMKLMEASKADNDEFQLELPLTLPEMQQ